MKRSLRYGIRGTLASLTAVTIVAALTLTSAMAQRGGRIDRSGGGSPGWSGGGSPQRDTSPGWNRTDPAPSRDSAPRRDTSPGWNRTDPAPNRDSAPRRDTSPGWDRTDPAPSRDSAPRRDTSPGWNRTDPAPSRDSAPRRDTSPGWNRTDPAPSRDSAPRRDTSPGWNRTDPAPSRDSAPRRDPALGNETSPGRRDNFGARGSDTPRWNWPGRETPGRTNGHDQAQSPITYRTQVPGVDQAQDGWRRNSERSPITYRTQVPGVDQARYLFSRSTEGRRFDNGITLRQARYYDDHYYRRYFPHGYAYYPYYSPTFVFGVVYYSPYAYYDDLAPLYIYRRHCHYYPPAAIYISIPIYRSNTWCGWNDDSDYYLYDEEYRHDPAYREEGLDRAIAAIEDAFRHDDVMPLVDLTDPSQQISVFRRGKYDYSMDANDYLDVTRDAMRVIQTVDFKIEHVRRKADGVWSLAGRHVYRDKNGSRRTVFVSFVLERIHGRWTITQVGTAPERLD